MSSFTSELLLKPLDDKKWILEKEFDFYIKNKTFKVPKGFITDFASTPKLFWNIIPPWGKYGKAAILHDYFYSSCIIKRKEADKIFLYAMGILKVPKWKRYLMYFGVRLFGKSHFCKK